MKNFKLNHVIILWCSSDLRDASVQFRRSVEYKTKTSADQHNERGRQKRHLTLKMISLRKKREKLSKSIIRRLP
jgi:hypothetical protein